MKKLFWTFYIVLSAYAVMSYLYQIAQMTDYLLTLSFLEQFYVFTVFTVVPLILLFLPEQIFHVFSEIKFYCHKGKKGKENE